MTAEDDAAAVRYAWLVLGLLVLIYGCNFVDRYVFIILMEPMKRDLRLSDTQLGLVSGLGFSAVYSIAGLGVARWADVANRRSILAVAAVTWSTLTAACGLAQSFVQLLFARMGVGLAESACSPPAHSLISDYFPPGRRGIAFSIYSVGLDVGLGLGFILGGWIGDHYGWRRAFIAAAIPGVLLGILVRLLVREPRRGAADASRADTGGYSARETVAYMLGRPSFVTYMLGSALFVFAGTAIDSWAPVFLMRVHSLSASEVGMWTGTLGSLAGFTGCLTAGWLADRLSPRDLRWHLCVATVGLALVIPATLAFLFSSRHVILIAYTTGVFFNGFYMAPTIAITHAIVPVRMRAFASAVLLLGYNLIGTAGANYLIGALSDSWSRSVHVNSIRYAMAASLTPAVAGVALTVFAMARLPRDFPEHFSRQSWASTPSSRMQTS